jgi:hypothetical protein
MTSLSDARWLCGSKNTTLSRLNASRASGRANAGIGAQAGHHFLAAELGHRECVGTGRLDNVDQAIAFGKRLRIGSSAGEPMKPATNRLARGVS